MDFKIGDIIGFNSKFTKDKWIYKIIDIKDKELYVEDYYDNKWNAVTNTFNKEYLLVGGRLGQFFCKKLSKIELLFYDIKN